MNRYVIIGIVVAAILGLFFWLGQRSKDGFDVNTFARKYFNGGGHFNAAGGQNKEPLEEVVRMFMAAMKENKDQLSNYEF